MNLLEVRNKIVVSGHSEVIIIFCKYEIRVSPKKPIITQAVNENEEKYMFYVSSRNKKKKNHE